MPIASLKAKVSAIANDLEKEEGSKQKTQLTKKATPSILSQDFVVIGDVVSSGLLEIEGRIKGNVKGNVVVLREGCFVEGKIDAESLSVRGNFEGNICAQNIEVTSKAKISGDIEYKSLSVEDGACIDARFRKLS